MGSLRRFTWLGLLLAGSATGANAEWVASWTAAPHAPLGTEGPFAAASYDNVTISQILRISEGGGKVRVRFSNRYGPAPLEIGAARVVQIDQAGKEVAGTSRMLTFGGEAGAVIPRGAPFVSDAVDVDLPDLARLKVEIYLPKATGPCTCHLTGTDELAVSPPGNFVGKPFEPVDRKQFRAFLSGVEVDSADARGTIVAYGDSITDGVGSTPGANRRWPDVLADRLQAAGQEWAVANQAISGNRVLSPGMGESALARFDEDVLSLPNVKYVIVFEGVNDIGQRFGPPRGPGGGPSGPGARPAADHGRADDCRLQADHRPRAREGHQGDRLADRPVQGRGLLDRGRRGRAPDRSTTGSSTAVRSMAWCASTRRSPIRPIPRRCARAITWAIICTAAMPG